MEVTIYGFTWQGVWSETTQYNIYDVVYRNGSAYNCVIANAGQDPATDNGTNWQVAASQGETGATGPQGGIGPTGATGPQGQPGATGPSGPIVSGGPYQVLATPVNGSTGPASLRSLTSADVPWYVPDAPDLTPSSYDDNFADTSLSSIWTPFGDSRLTVTLQSKHLHLSLPGETAFNTYIVSGVAQSAVPSGNWTAVTRVQMMQTNSALMAGIVLLPQGNTEGVFFGMTNEAINFATGNGGTVPLSIPNFTPSVDSLTSALQLAASPANVNTSYTGYTAGTLSRLQSVYLKLVNANGILSCLVSVDGVYWVVVLSISSITGTPQIGLGVNNSNEISGPNTYPFDSYFEFFHLYESADPGIIGG